MEGTTKLALVEFELQCNLELSSSAEGSNKSNLRQACAILDILLLAKLYSKNQSGTFVCFRDSGLAKMPGLSCSPLPGMI